MDNFFVHLNKKPRDFGYFKRRTLNEQLFDFEGSIEIGYLIRTELDAFMCTTAYFHNDEEFELNIIFSQDQLVQVAASLQLLDSSYADFLNEAIVSPFRDYEEIEFPNDKSMSMLMTGQIALDMEDDLKAMGEDFIPFRAVEIQGCSLTKP